MALFDTWIYKPAWVAGVWCDGIIHPTKGYACQSSKALLVDVTYFRTCLVVCNNPVIIKENLWVLHHSWLQTKGGLTGFLLLIKTSLLNLFIYTLPTFVVILLRCTDTHNLWRSEVGNWLLPVTCRMKDWFGFCHIVHVCILCVYILWSPMIEIN